MITKDNINKEIGRRIKNFRQISHLSQEELAHRVGFKSKNTISTIESGTKSIKADELVLIAEVLDINPAILLGVEEPKAVKVSDNLYEELDSFTKSMQELADGLRKTINNEYYDKFLKEEKSKSSGN